MGFVTTLFYFNLLSQVKDNSIPHNWANNGIVPVTKTGKSFEVADRGIQK